MKRLLFIIDAPHTLKAYKDTSIAMMRAAAAYGLEVFVCEVGSLLSEATGGVSAWVSRAELFSDDHDWARFGESRREALKAFDAVWMRKDPPFDIEYFYATHLLSRAQQEGAKVFNDPEALRNFPEKLAILAWPQLTAPTLVTRERAAMDAFYQKHRDVILKPLDGMGGRGIFRVGEDGRNWGSVIETLTHNGTQTIMLQQFIPEVQQGDKRIILLGGKAVPYALARVPQGTEVRANLATGGKAVVQPLSARDQAIAEAIGPTLAAQGLFFVGLDVIGDYLTEINVTSPTGFVEITTQSGFDVGQAFIEAFAKSFGNIQ